MSTLTPLPSPLAGFHAVSLAINLPGPAAAHLLTQQGLAVTKVEPPGGDLLSWAAPELYRQLAQGQETVVLNLRTPEGQAEFQRRLRCADLLITSQRPAALARLGVSQETLHALNPQLCWVAIVGDTDVPEVPGHDLTYQLQAGLLSPPAMPRTLLADLAGAQDAARAALGLLLGRERGQAQRCARVGLKQAAGFFAAPLDAGMTVGGGLLSGAHPQYRLYPVQGGWAGVAALEPHFAARLRDLLGAGAGALEEQELATWLAGLSVDECNRLAEEHDLPVHAVQLDTGQVAGTAQ
ncbi:CoA transferase [Deinococcus sp. SL84]|uniref:CoA transferase n=1 Tax=Deinococcus sp. SL84 TaxID=2994663 RepID=UPI002274BFE0|nr:CoA transferase [Deinococcus sp. SL84]MCY1703469.1 CoA transferase [Deinococcus sp. SL84]